MVSCVAKWEITTISLTVWHVGYQSHGIWEILIFSQQNLPFLKCVKRVYVI